MYFKAKDSHQQLDINNCLVKFLSKCGTFCENLRNKLKTIIRHFRVPQTPGFNMRLSAQPFLWKWVFLHENEKSFPYQNWALTSFWCKGPGNYEMALSRRFSLHQWKSKGNLIEWFYWTREIGSRILRTLMHNFHCFLLFTSCYFCTICYYWSVSRFK